MGIVMQIREILENMSSEELKDILEGGFSFLRTFGGQPYAIRRASDQVLDEKTRRVRTEFYAYPENGERKRQMKGVMFRIEGTAENLDDRKIVFSEAGNVHVWPSFKAETYAALTASRAGRTIGGTGANTFLHHRVEILTPKKETVALEEFDFGAEPLFMLGLYGGDYKLRVAEK